MRRRNAHTLMLFFQKKDCRRSRITLGGNHLWYLCELITQQRVLRAQLQGAQVRQQELQPWGLQLRLI